MQEGAGIQVLGSALETPAVRVIYAGHMDDARPPGL